MPAENIFAAYAQPVRSMADYADELDQRQLRGLQLQGQQRQNAIAELTAQQTRDTLRQGGMEREALRAAAAQSNGDPKALIQRLRASGMPGLLTQADTLEKGLIERTKGEAAAGKDTAEAEKVRQSMQKAALMDHIQIIGGLSDPGQVTEYLSQASDIPEMRRNAMLQSLQSVRSLPELQQWQARAVLTLAAPQEQAKAMQPNYQAAGGSMVNTNTLAAGAAPIPITQSRDNAANQATALAGQRRIAADALAGRQQAERLATGTVTYQQDADGNLVALPTRAAPGAVIKAQAVTAPGAGMVPLPGKDAGMTEGQEKSLMFGTKMAQSAKVLDEVGKDADMRGAIKGTAMAAAGLVPFIGDKVADIAGTLTNKTQSTAQQRYEAAKYQWIAGLLRKESGAVINPSEYADADNQYFPQPGDDDQTKADKAKQRLLQQQTMLEGVPRNKRPKDAAPATPKPRAVLRFDAQGNLLP